ncbi:hypothetical protein Tdes44962_MAKER05655 [Teratosphaeria destructans]|uniref:Uncharacterized protein n=1 Tax=Teratosphaeria destructans TaxID=418781 RepID=A0A9W7VYI4_9PEZI|nr:hypothetical protein Tdes44962_MAKER05655 [Teratosphaeria destructans]
MLFRLLLLTLPFISPVLGVRHAYYGRLLPLLGQLSRKLLLRRILHYQTPMSAPRTRPTN